MTFLEAALAHPSCVLSVMGDHASESADAIFYRKIADINRLGKTFWLMRSPKARPAKVQGICESAPSYTIFVEPATKGGARPTKEEDAAKEYSDDGVSWYRLPKNLSPVTGKLDKSAAALVFDKMTTNVTGSLDLWCYADFSDILEPIKFILGCSTVCAIKSENFSIGIRGYYYQQITGDSGSGAVLGDFKSESYGLGPGFVWIPKFAGGALTVLGKWMHDLHAEDRFDSDYFTLTAAWKF